MKIKIATRKSPLALWQANYIKGLLESYDAAIKCNLVPIQTTADAHLKPLHDIGGKGLFVRSIQEAVLDERADIAVHSAKDLPCQTSQYLTLACVPKRGEVTDVLVSDYNLQDLPSGAVIATGSPRRRMQLLDLKPSLKVEATRGNVQTRILQWQEGKFDGILLAKAGLCRMGLQDHIKQVFSIEQILPAAGQGALAVECLSSRADLIKLLGFINHRDSYAALVAERACLQFLGGHCQSPIGAYAKVKNHELTLLAKINADKVIYASKSSLLDNAFALGKKVADILNQQGAQDLLKNVK